jgi:hypothetical protein
MAAAEAWVPRERSSPPLGKLGKPEVLGKLGKPEALGKPGRGRARR